MPFELHLPLSQVLIVMEGVELVSRVLLVAGMSALLPNLKGWAKLGMKPMISIHFMAYVLVMYYCYIMLYIYIYIYLYLKHIYERMYIYTLTHTYI